MVQRGFEISFEKTVCLFIGFMLFGLLGGLTSLCYFVFVTIVSLFLGYVCQKSRNYYCIGLDAWDVKVITRSWRILYGPNNQFVSLSIIVSFLEW